MGGIIADRYTDEVVEQRMQENNLETTIKGAGDKSGFFHVFLIRIILTPQ